MHNNSGYNLDFLFIAEDYNGTLYQQSPDDRPRFSPSGSSFTDVLKMHVKKFSLVGKGHMLTIDLTDGHAEMDGRMIYPEKAPSKYPLKLIYYRQVQRHTILQSSTGKTGILGALGIQTEAKPVTVPVVRYYIGWESDNGKNKWVLGID